MFNKIDMEAKVKKQIDTTKIVQDKKSTISIKKQNEIKITQTSSEHSKPLIVEIKCDLFEKVNYII